MPLLFFAAHPIPPTLRAGPGTLCKSWRCVVATGDTMPQNGTIFEGRGRGVRFHTSKDNAQAPATASIEGVILLNGDPTATTRTSGSRPACTPNGTPPHCMVNGYINHGHKEKSKKSPPTQTPRKQEGMDSLVHDASAAGSISTAAITPAAISENGATSLDSVASPCHSDQTPPKPTLIASAKKRRRRRSCRHQKRSLPMPPHVAEDWESDIQDVTSPVDWEKMSFGVMPYGPEDVLHFALRDLTLKQTDPIHPSQTGNYCPRVYHPRPVQWSCCRICSEPDQFVDADA